MLAPARTLGIALLCLSPALAALAGCTSEQAEGKRCDVRNGSLDCQAPLVCRLASELNVQESSEGVALCCPAPGQPVSVEACTSTSAVLPDDEPVGDAGVRGPASSTLPASPNSTDASVVDASLPPVVDASTSTPAAAVDAALPDASPSIADSGTDAASGG